MAAVNKSETEELWSMSYTEIVPLTVQMTQKALEKIAFLQDQIEQLYSYIGELKMQEN